MKREEYEMGGCDCAAGEGRERREERREEKRREAKLIICRRGGQARTEK